MSILILLCVAQFMVIVDLTIVNVALPTIGATLQFASPADLQWVVTAYVLFSGGLLLLGGRTADLLGRRRVLVAGLMTFAIASLASGLAPSPLALIVSRAAQGLGAAFLTPAALSIVTTTYTGARRTTALAAWGAIGAIGAAVGVLIGGTLTGLFGWESIFFVNVPIGLGATFLTLRLVPATTATARSLREVDIAGSLTLITGLFLLVYALDGTAFSSVGSSETLVLLALAAVFFAGFVIVERTVERPLIEPATWRVRSLVSGVAVMLGVSGIMGGSFFLNSLYLQEVLRASPLQAGLAFFPFAAVITVSSQIGSRLLAHLPTRSVLVLGLVATAGGVLLLARVPDHASYFADLLPGLVILGTGLGSTSAKVGEVARGSRRVD